MSPEDLNNLLKMEIEQMLAPIITKDMKLFPSRPLPAGIKNVRSRAQSLDQVTQQQRSQSLRGRVAPVRHRNSQSVGNLPIAGHKTPPKPPITRKTTLNPIAEGVELKDEVKPETSSAFELLDKREQRVQRLRGPPVNSDGEIFDEKEKENHGVTKIKNPKEKNRGVIRWITNAIRSRSKSDSQEDNISTNST